MTDVKGLITQKGFMAQWVSTKEKRFIGLRRVRAGNGTTVRTLNPSEAVADGGALLFSFPELEACPPIFCVSAKQGERRLFRLSGASTIGKMTFSRMTPEDDS